MKIYISGPITGMPGLNRQAFRNAAAALYAAGYSFVNPHDIAASSPSWVDHMRADIKILVECDGVALLPGWGRSPGAGLEVRIALDLGMPCRPVDEWLAKVPA